MKSIAFILILTTLSVSAQSTWSFDNAARADRILNDITFLARDSMMGREGGSDYEWDAGDYIIEQYEQCGLIPVPGLDKFRQSFFLGGSTDEGSDTTSKISCNILGYINNNAPYTIVIGGHYDHIGYYYKDDTLLHICNGADDNASGAAGVIEMARYLSSGNLVKYNYIMACWGSEEQGLVGSNYFCQTKVFPFEKIAFYVNFDMIGRLGWKTDQLDIYGLGSSMIWDSVVVEAKYDKYNLKKFDGAVDASDHTCFYQNKIPFIYFTSGLPPVYHTPKDETPLINKEGVELIISYTEEIIARFDGSKPAFRQVSQKEMNKVYWYFMSQFMN